MFELLHYMQQSFLSRGEKRERTWLKLGDSLSDALHDAGSLMAQHYGENSLRVGATKCVGVSVTDPCGQNLK